MVGLCTRYGIWTGGREEETRTSHGKGSKEGAVIETEMFAYAEAMMITLPSIGCFTEQRVNNVGFD